MRKRFKHQADRNQRCVKEPFFTLQFFHDDWSEALAFGPMNGSGVLTSIQRWLRVRDQYARGEIPEDQAQAECCEVIIRHVAIGKDGES